MSIQASPSPTTNPPVSARRADGPAWAARGYAMIGGVFAFAVLAQVFVAGGALFVAPGWWHAHALFGMILSFGPVIMLALALVARVPARTTWLTALLLGLTLLQAALPTLPAKIGLPGLAALHPVNAVILFALAAVVAWQIWRSGTSAPMKAAR